MRSQLSVSWMAVAVEEARRDKKQRGRSSFLSFVHHFSFFFVVFFFLLNTIPEEPFLVQGRRNIEDTIRVVFKVGKRAFTQERSEVASSGARPAQR